MAPAEKSTKHQSSKNTKESTSQKNRQWSISKLFQSSEQKRSSIDLVQSPGSKRRKTEESARATDDTLLATPSSDANMYNFSGSRPTDSDVFVDLTGSSPPGPTSPNRKARRLSLTARVDNSSLNSGVKRLPVKNLRAGPRTDPSEYCNKTLVQLSEGLSAIFEGGKPLSSNEELYRGAENLCKLGRAPELTKKLLEQCKQHVSADFKDTLSPKAGHDSVEVLQGVLSAWATWNKQLVC